MITRLSRRPGTVAIFVGSRRYVDHDLRELAPDFALLKPVVDLEDTAIAYDAALALIKCLLNLLVLRMERVQAAGKGGERGDRRRGRSRPRPPTRSWRTDA